MLALNDLNFAIIQSICCSLKFITEQCVSHHQTHQIFNTNVCDEILIRLNYLSIRNAHLVTSHQTSTAIPLTIATEPTPIQIFCEVVKYCKPSIES